MALQLKSMRTAKISIISFAVLATGIIMQPYLATLPVFASSEVVIRPDSTEWTPVVTSGGLVSYKATPGAPLGNGAVLLSTTDSNDSITRLKHAVTMPLKDVTSLSYQTKRVVVPAAAAGYGNASMRISLDFNNDGNIDDQLMYEPYYNGSVNNGWQTWDVAHGKFWSNWENTYNNLGGPGAGSDSTNFTIADVLHDKPDAMVVGIMVSMGSWNPSQQILIDNVKLNSTTYDFEPAIQTPSTVVVYGDTATGENQPGWLFNRDTSTATPFEFTSAEHSIGAGSIYVKPIGTNPADKFIAEDFAKTAVSDFNSFSYDFKVAGNGTAASANQFYASAYVNQINDNKYYDCRYDFAPVAGSTTAFTKFGFDSSTQPVFVKTSSTSRLGKCPATLSALPAGSTIRAFTINVGDTSASDAGLAGYIDNIVLDTASAITTTDFEMMGAPQNLTPANNSFTTNDSFDNTWLPVAGAAKYEYETTYFNGASYYHDTSDAGNYVMGQSLITRHNNGAPEATYKWHVRAINANGQAGPWSDYSNVTVDKTAPTTPANGQPNNSYKATNKFDFTWDPSTDQNAGVTYEFQSTHNPAQVSNVLTTDLWKSAVLPTNMIHSVGASDGTWYWQVRATDAAGNKSAWSPIWNMTIDTVDPAVAITQPGAGGVVKSLSVDIEGSATDSNFSYYYCYVTTVGGGEVGVRDALCQTAWAAGTPFKTAFTPSANGLVSGHIGTITLPSSAANGQYVVHVIAKDKAGNTVAKTQPFTLSIPTPTVNAEDFGVGSWTLVSDGFTGYNVGFNVNDFATVTSISVDLYRGDTKITTNTATAALLAKITSSNLKSLSTAFPTQGTVEDNWCSGVSCWNIGTATWTSLSTAPTKAVITVTGTDIRGQNATPQPVVIENPSQAGGTYASILPAAVTAPALNLPGNAGNTPAATNATAATAGRNRAIAQQNPAAAQAVLGAETQKDTPNTDVLGATAAPTLAAVDSKPVSASSLAWYWWVAAAAVVVGVIWWIAAAMRRHAAEDSIF